MASPGSSGPVSPTSFATRYPVYQIDFQAVAAGKRIATTKRRIRWRFGYPNLRALEEGLTGTACRGEEHDVTIVWSVTSGKREVSMDGREVHFSTNRSGILEFSWSTRGNHVIKIIAHAAPPLSATPGFRQYDLWIDGQSFFSMPKVYELGLRGPAAAQARVPGRYDYGPPSADRGFAAPPAPNSGRFYDLNRGAYVEPANREQEEEDLQRAIKASLEESRRHLEKANSMQGSLTGSQISNQGQPNQAPPPRPVETNLLDFGSDSAPPLALPPADSQSVASFTTYPPANVPPAYGGAPPQYGYSSPAPPGPSNNLLALPAPPGVMSPDAASIASAPPYVTSGAGPYYNAQPPPAPAPAYYGAPPPASSNQYGYPPGPGDSYNPAPAPVPYSEPYAAQSQQPVDTFATLNQFQQPVPPADDPFAPRAPPPPTASDINRSILDAYGSPPPGTPNYAGGPGSGFQSPLAPGQPLTLENGNYAQDGANLTMNGYVDTQEPEPADELTRAMKKLVNFDRIDEPAEQEIKLTMQKQEKEKQGKKNKSKGLPPAAVGLVGTQATLSQIKAVKPEKAPTVETVMNPAPMLFSGQAAQAGALVVYGQAPPQLQPQGFGAGAAMYGGGYGQGYQQGYYQQPPPQPGYYQQPPPQSGYYQQQQPPPPQQQAYNNY